MQFLLLSYLFAVQSTPTRSANSGIQKRSKVRNFRNTLNRGTAQGKEGVSQQTSQASSSSKGSGSSGGII